MYKRDRDKDTMYFPS